MIRVGIVYGGNSPEYEFSLQSAETLIENIDLNKFTVVPIHVDRQGNWIVNDRTPLSTKHFPTSSFYYPTKVVSHLPCDVIFSVMHGASGENGTIQALFELWNIPYVGSGLLGSAIGMHKFTAKQLVLVSHAAEVVPDLYINQGDYQSNRIDPLSAIEKIGYPIFVKPAAAGSSVGVHRITDSKDLPDALTDAFQYSDSIVIEKALEPMRELEVAVLENLDPSAPPIVSAIGEVIPKNHFYSYIAKSSLRDSPNIQIPANLSKSQVKRIEQAALKVFKVLYLRDTARIDFFLDTRNDRLYFNEVNTLPGLTSMSMYPKLWMASDKSFSEVITQLIRLALCRNNRLVNYSALLQNYS